MIKQDYTAHIKVCKHPEKRKSHEESCDSSWDFGALEGTRIPGPLIKSQMLYRLSYERIFRSKTILPNNITTIGRKMQERRRKKRKFPHKRPELRRMGLSGTEHLGGSRCAVRARRAKNGAEWQRPPLLYYKKR